MTLLNDGGAQRPQVLSHFSGHFADLIVSDGAPDGALRMLPARSAL